MKGEKIVGIYKITSPTNKIYIGRSINIKQRFSGYRSLHGSKEQGKLHKSFLKHGVNAHVFEIIEECHVSCLDDREKHYISFFKSNSRKGLNIRAGGFGQIHAKETIDKIRSANLGKKRSEETRRKMSESKKGKPTWNKGLKGAQVAWNKGKPWDEKNRLRVSTQMKGKKLSDETKNKMSKAAKGVPKSKEHAAKVGLANRGKYVSPETREKQRISRENYLKSIGYGKQ